MNIPPISDSEVIVCGAGPVGLFLACELALAGCSVLVLEKAPEPDSPLKRLPFGMRGLSAPTVEALYRRGLLVEFELYQRLKNPHANAISGPRRQVGHFAGIPLEEGLIDVSRWTDRLPGSPPAQLMTEMAEVESILARRAESLGVEVRRGVGITGFEQDEDGVLVTMGDCSVRCQWLVGCDGGRSLVRREAGIEFAGTEPEFTGYSVQADLVDPELLQPGRHLTEKGMYFQSQPGFLIIQDFDGGAGHSAEPPSLEQVQSVLRRVSGTDVTIQTLHAATTWTDRARQATTYRKGRVLLAGDAAHIHAPLGGQGLNLGLGDAMNLGWKLAATIQGQAPEGLLDTYEAERHPIGVRVLDWSRAQVAIMRPDPAARALNAIMRDLIDTTDGATYMASRVWGVNTFYPTESGHRLVGHSAPNFEFQDGSSIFEEMRSGQGILLDFDGQPALESFAADHSLCYISGGARETLGVSAMLIRPDGIVAWASDEDEPSLEDFQQAARRWFTGRNLEMDR